MPTHPSEYLRTKVLTANPEELQLLLYDGAIRFASQAREELAGGNKEQAYHLLIRAQRIVLEMISGLQHEVNPELCGRLASLYNFIYRKLVEANMNRQTEPIDDALKILRFERETWVLVMQRIRQDDAGEAEAGQPAYSSGSPAAGPRGGPALPYTAVSQVAPSLNIQG